MRKSLKHFPLGICREDFDTEEDYQYAIEHYWDLYNMAEDMAMEEHYEKRNGGGEMGERCRQDPRRGETKAV